MIRKKDSRKDVDDRFKNEEERCRNEVERSGESVVIGGNAPECSAILPLMLDCETRGCRGWLWSKSVIVFRVPVVVVVEVVEVIQIVIIVIVVVVFIIVVVIIVVAVIFQIVNLFRNWNSNCRQVTLLESFCPIRICPSRCVDRVNQNQKEEEKRNDVVVGEFSIKSEDEGRAFRKFLFQFHLFFF